MSIPIPLIGLNSHIKNSLELSPDVAEIISDNKNSNDSDLAIIDENTSKEIYLDKLATGDLNIR